MATACCEPQFLQFNESIDGIQFIKHKSQTGDSISPIEDHVQKNNTEEDYEGEEEWWNNAFMQEEHVQIQKEAAITKENLELDEDMDNEIEFDPDIKSVRCFANESIKWYNRRTGAKYKLKRVLKATAFWVTGFSYVIRFTAEECKSGHKRDEPALKFLAYDDEGDKKVFYNSSDDKPSDKLFEGSVYWKLPDCSVTVDSCVIKTQEEEGNTEEAEEDYDNEDESVSGIVFDRNIKRVRSFAIDSLRWYKRQRVGQVFFFLLLTGCYVLAK